MPVITQIVNIQQTSGEITRNICEFILERNHLNVIGKDVNIGNLLAN